MIARWVLTANVSLLAFNVVLLVSNWLLLKRIKTTHVRLDDARIALARQMDEHRKSVLEVLRD